MEKFEVFKKKKVKAVPKIKGKWLEVMRIARALKVATVAKQVVKDAIEAASSEFVNADARVVDEEYVQIFGITKKITRRLEIVCYSRYTEIQYLTKFAKIQLNS